MSLNYGYIFSQIDKAKKKTRGKQQWNSPESKKLQAKFLKEQKDKKTYTQGTGFTTAHAGGNLKIKKPISEKLTRVPGRKRGKGPHAQSTEQRTRNIVPFKGEKQIIDVGTKDEGKIHRGTDRKGLARDSKAEKERRQAADDKKKLEDKLRLTDFPPVTDESAERFNAVLARQAAQARAGSGKKRGVDTEQTNEAVEAAKKRKIQARTEASLDTYNRYLKEQEARLKRQQKKEAEAKKKKEGAKTGIRKPKKPKDVTPQDNPEDPIDEYQSEGDNVEEDDGDEGPVTAREYKETGKALWKSWLIKREVRISDLPQGGSGKVEEIIDAQRHGAISGAAKRKRRKAKELLEGIESLEKDDDKNDKEKEDNNKEKEVKSILEDAKRYGTGNPRASDMYKSWLEEKLKAEEGMGGMNMGAQRGLGHEAGYIQGTGQSTQITEVEDEKNVEKDGKNIHGYPHGKCTRCGHYMESEEYQTAEHSFKNPKEGEKVCNDCFDQEQGEFEAENFGGEENKVFGKQDDSNISHIDPKKKKSAYENHEQDESPESKPNKQQIPASKPGMDVIRSMYKKALIIKYKNIYKPLNT